MRHISIFLVLVCLVAFTMPAIAQEVAPKPEVVGQHGLTNTDIEQLKDAAHGLRQVFGVEEPEVKKPVEKTGEKRTEETPVPKKSMADVADKAVDMAGKMVAQAAEQLEKVAPDVWRIMIKQQYAQAISGVIVPMSLFLLTICYFRIARKYWKYEKANTTGGDTPSERDMCFLLVHILPFIAGFILAGWTATRLSYSVMYLINPEYYAIRDMLMMILNKGNGG